MGVMRLLIWKGVEEWLTEVVSVELTERGLMASGTQLRPDPEPFRVDYRLDATDGFVTCELDATAIGDGWRRTLALRHDGSGGWQAEVEGEGEVPGEPADDALPDLSRARDIDLEFSPLTNTMPILRNGFHEGGSGDFLMAFVTTPSLRVHASPQRYEHLRVTDAGAVVRYVSLDSDFTADLELDTDGLLEFYPRLGRRVAPGEMASPV
jgi:uncharacterized protein